MRDNMQGVTMKPTKPVTEKEKTASDPQKKTISRRCASNTQSTPLRLSAKPASHHQG
jgi:hypothetical protein